MAKKNKEQANLLRDAREEISLELEKDYFTPALQTAVKKQWMPISRQKTL